MHITTPIKPTIISIKTTAPTTAPLALTIATKRTTGTHRSAKESELGTAESKRQHPASAGREPERDGGGLVDSRHSGLTSDYRAWAIGTDISGNLDPLLGAALSCAPGWRRRRRGNRAGKMLHGQTCLRTHLCGMCDYMHVSMDVDRSGSLKYT